MNYLKKFLLPVCLMAVFSLTLISCEKDNDTDTTTTTPKTKTELLTSKTWLYDEYFRNYNSSNTILYYKRDKTNNLINLDINRVTFRADGTYTELNETGTTLNGTWKFLNNESQIQVASSAGTYTSLIIKLDEDEFYWLDTNTSNGTLGKYKN